MKIKKSELKDEIQLKLADLLSPFDEKNELKSKDYEIQIESLETPKILYHYTSLSTFLNILKQVKDQQFILRGTDIKYLNDWSEMDYGTNILSECLKYYESCNPEKENKSNQITPDKWREFLTLSTFKSEPFITSLSQNQDNLPMWSMYGDDGNGIAIGLDFNIIKLEYNNSKIAKLRKCKYDNKLLLEELKSNDKILEILYNTFGIKESRIYLNPNIAYNELAIRICIQKHPSYEYENEWRLIKKASLFETDNNINVNSTTLKPFIENKIQICAIKEIVVGPCKNFELTKNLIKIALSNADIELNKIQIVQSSAPYRQNI